MQIINERNAIIQELNRNGYKAVQLDSEEGEVGIVVYVPESENSPFAQILWTLEMDAWTIRSEGVGEFVNMMKINRCLETALGLR